MGFTYAPVNDQLSIRKFHKNLPHFKPTPLIPISDTTEHGKLFLKDESNRAGLPSFKILGASWGAFRAIVSKLGLPIDTDPELVAELAREHQLVLHAATDGNHGRAIARMAHILGISAVIYVPINYVGDTTVEAIRNEGATVCPSEQDYDGAVLEAFTNYKNDNTSKVVFVQDTSFPGYSEIPTWIIDGYSTMLIEVEEQLQLSHLRATHIITPVGVGSLAHAVVTYCKSEGRNISVVTVEPETAACLNKALATNDPTPIKTGRTIMEGMNCGTVSEISWPILRNGVNISLMVTETECHEAIQSLSAQHINTGPCGAATYAGYMKLFETMPEQLHPNQDSVIVMLATEGPRVYQVPGLSSDQHDA